MTYFCKRCEREVPDDEVFKCDSGTMRHKTPLASCRGVIILSSGQKIQPKKSSMEKLLDKHNVGKEIR